MIKLIKKYRNLSFEEKTILNTRISILTNSIFAVAKLVLSLFFGVFFFVAGLVNVFIAISKLECLIGAKDKSKKSFIHTNNMIGLFLLLAGVQYSIYMARLIFTDVEVMDYSMFLGINIALVSFIEMGFAIKGLFNAYGKGHYYRNIKLINLCSALTAMTLTEIAITSFASEVDTRIIDGIFGMSVGTIIILISLFVFVAPYISIVDREHNLYKIKDNQKIINQEEIIIPLTKSKFYGSYSYVGIIKDQYIDGHIIQGKSPIWQWNIYIKILIIILSEILIFVYAGGALIYYFKNSKLIKKLDKKMLDLGCEKIEIKEDM